MRKTMNLILLGGLSLLTLAGCSKQGLDQLFSRAAGEEVVFGAVSRSYNPLTKTAYSGETTTVDGKKRERIDWVKGDQFRVYSNVAKQRYLDQNWADYQIMQDAAITNSGAVSSVAAGSIEPITEATIGNGVSKNGLVWENGQQEFYAIYPMSEGYTYSNKVVSGASIPETQDGKAEDVKQYGYLVAKASATGGADSNGAITGAVELAFEPAFTAFEITIKTDESETADIPVTKFELISGAEALSGSFSVNFGTSAASYTCPTSASNISVTFPTGTKIGKTEETQLKFTVFALPQDFSKLSLRFTLEDDVTRTLPLTYAKATDGHAAGDAITFAGCLKHRIYGLAMQNRWILYVNPLTVDELDNVNAREGESMFFNF